MGDLFYYDGCNLIGCVMFRLGGGVCFGFVVLLLLFRFICGFVYIISGFMYSLYVFFVFCVFGSTHYKRNGLPDKAPPRCRLGILCCCHPHRYPYGARRTRVYVQLYTIHVYIYII